MTTATTTTPRVVDSGKSVVAGCGDQTASAHMITHITNATPSIQNEPLKGQDLVAVVKTIVDRTVVKLSTIKESLHFLHHKVDHADLVEALQVAGIIEIDCKVHCIINKNDFIYFMQWLTTTHKGIRFFTRQQVGDCTDKVCI